MLTKKTYVIGCTEAARLTAKLGSLLCWSHWIVLTVVLKENCRLCEPWLVQIACAAYSTKVLVVCRLSALSIKSCGTYRTTTDQATSTKRHEGSSCSATLLTVRGTKFGEDDRGSQNITHLTTRLCCVIGAHSGVTKHRRFAPRPLYPSTFPHAGDSHGPEKR